MSSKKHRVVVIGGGASGFFSAIRCAQYAKDSGKSVSVQVLEATPNFLKKVGISGGGRCNVTHHQFEIQKFCENYPRGKKELRSPFHTFQAQDTVAWFRDRGVKLVYEADGRMFPSTNRSSTIIDCFINEAEKLKVVLKTKHNVQSLSYDNKVFTLDIRNEEKIECDSLIIATGSSPVGYRLAKSLGHKITDLAPSLFSFKISDSLLKDLSGTSFLQAKLKLNIDGFKQFKQDGPILITHWGLSGPAILKLSAWGAREFKQANYKATLAVNWLGYEKLSEVEDLIRQIKEDNLKTNLSNAYPTELSKRFWEKLLQKLDVASDKKYTELSKKDFNKICESLYNYRFQIDGKNRYKDEFVECGGVNLKEIDFKCMQSKLVDSLYFTGELLDIDGITGGFNFQNAWTTAWLAGSHIVDSL